MWISGLFLAPPWIHYLPYENGGDITFTVCLSVCPKSFENGWTERDNIVHISWHGIQTQKLRLDLVVT